MRHRREREREREKEGGRKREASVVAIRFAGSTDKRSRDSRLELRPRLFVDLPPVYSLPWRFIPRKIYRREVAFESKLANLRARLSSKESPLVFAVAVATAAAAAASSRLVTRVWQRRVLPGHGLLFFPRRQPMTRFNGRENASSVYSVCDVLAEDVYTGFKSAK